MLLPSRAWRGAGRSGTGERRAVPRDPDSHRRQGPLPGARDDVVDSCAGCLVAGDGRCGARRREEGGEVAGGFPLYGMVMNRRVDESRTAGGHQQHDGAAAGEEHESDAAFDEQPAMPRAPAGTEQ